MIEFAAESMTDEEVVGSVIIATLKDNGWNVLSDDYNNIMAEKIIGGLLIKVGGIEVETPRTIITALSEPVVLYFSPKSPETLWKAVQYLMDIADSYGGYITLVSNRGNQSVSGIYRDLPEKYTDLFSSRCSFKVRVGGGDFASVQTNDITQVPINTKMVIDEIEKFIAGFDYDDIETAASIAEEA